MNQKRVDAWKLLEADGQDGQPGHRQSFLQFLGRLHQQTFNTAAKPLIVNQDDPDGPLTVLIPNSAGAPVASIEQVEAKTLQWTLDAAKGYTAKSLEALEGAQSLVFISRIVCGYRFTELFKYHRAFRNTNAAKQLGLTTWASWLNVVAPGVSEDFVYQHRRLFRFFCIYPNIGLVSSCSFNEFLQYEQMLLQCLENSPEEALCWRRSETEQMQFLKVLQYADSEGRPFSSFAVAGVEMTTENFHEARSKAFYNLDVEAAELEQKRKASRQKVEELATAVAGISLDAEPMDEGEEGEEGEELDMDEVNRLINDE